MAPDTLARLKDGTAEVVPEGGLEEKLTIGRPLRVKLGLDPTASDVTLGWAVVLHKLRQFQDAGHVAVLIVGDFTARVGDPSGKSETRPRLEKDVVKAYANRLLEQFGLILSSERLEVRYNSEWLEAMDMEGVLRLTSSYTVAQMLQRDDFATRYAEGRPISIMEFMYPLLQGYDSVAVEADVELGGTDQLFNLLVGRELQRAWGQEPQIAVTVPLIEGLDGVQKMSQSLGNYVGITEPSDEMFGKLMRIPDELISKYLRLAAWLPSEEIARIEAGLANGASRPNEEKRSMARAVVDLYHGQGAGERAEDAFNRVHRDRELPEVVPDIPIPEAAIEDGVVWLPRLLVALDQASSNGHARRKIEQGGVKLNDEPITDPAYEASRDELAGKVLQVGRRWFGRLA
ncbi:MAG: tyrosine--tRNA ligase [Actinomycetota bacterium]